MLLHLQSEPDHTRGLRIAAEGDGGVAVWPTAVRPSALLILTLEKGWVDEGWDGCFGCGSLHALFPGKGCACCQPPDFYLMKPPSSPEGELRTRSDWPLYRKAEFCRGENFPLFSCAITELAFQGRESSFLSCPATSMTRFNFWIFLFPDNRNVLSGEKLQCFWTP